MSGSTCARHPGFGVVWAEGFEVTDDVFYPNAPGEFALVGDGAWAGE